MTAAADRNAVSRPVPALLAGALAGVTGLLVFLLIHHVWILPIWFILPPGLAIAGLGGLAVGWAYGHVHDRLPAGPWRHVAFNGLIALTLAPGIALAELRPALFDADTGELSPGTDLLTVATRFAAELLLPAMLVGALAGWYLAGRRAACTTGLAGLVFALGPGHNIPLLGGTAGAAKGAVFLASIVVVSTFVLVETHARLSRASSNGHDQGASGLLDGGVRAGSWARDRVCPTRRRNAKMRTSRSSCRSSRS